MTRLFEAKPFIIAEVGSNWQTLDHCLESIRIAKECGADAVKFQAFDWPSLYGVDQISVDPNGIPDGHAIPRWTRMPHELPLEWLPRLKQKADKVGIEFMCTAFSPELVKAVDPFVSVHKVASSDAAWPQMLQAVKATGKPALYSLGAKTFDESDQIIRVMGDRKYIAMYCVAAYPADYIDFDKVSSWDGFSDHSLGYTAAVHAARLGTRVIEKHFTAFPGLETPDRPHSLMPKQFTNMVRIIRGYHGPIDADLRQEIDTGHRPDGEEQAMFLRHNRRLIATRDVMPGETLTYGENFGAYRSLEDDTRGLSPFAWETVEGRKAAWEIKRGKPIGTGDFI